MTLAQFIDMGGYAKFVWPCYGLTLVVLILNIIAGRRRLAAELAAARRRSTPKEVRS
jgi:heme exporter protein CcmD